MILKGNDHEKHRDEHRGVCLDDQSGPFKGVRAFINRQDDHHCIDGRERDDSKSAREGWAQCLPEEVVPVSAIWPYRFHREVCVLFRPALDRSETASRRINESVIPRKV